jgi:hypothetical protein
VRARDLPFLRELRAESGERHLAQAVEADISHD